MKNMFDLHYQGRDGIQNSLRRALGSWFYYSLVILVVGDLVFSSIFLVFWSHAPVSSHLDLFFLIQAIITLLVLAGTTVGIVQTSLEGQTELNASASELRWGLYAVFEQLAIEFDSLILARSSGLSIRDEEELKIREQRERISRLIVEKARNIVPDAVDLSSEDHPRTNVERHRKPLVERTASYIGMVGLSGLSVIVAGVLLTWLFKYLAWSSIRREILWLALFFAIPCGLLVIFVATAAVLRMKSRAVFAFIRQFGSTISKPVFIAGLTLLGEIILVKYLMKIHASHFAVLLQISTWLGYLLAGCAIACAAVLLGKATLSFLDQYFGCPHKRLTFPVATPLSRKAGGHLGDAHVTCLECGREFTYDWEQMKIVSPAGHGKRGVAAGKEVTASANDQG